MPLLSRSFLDLSFQNLSNVLANSLPLRTLPDVCGRLLSLHESAELSPFSGPLLPCVEVSLLPSVELLPFSCSLAQNAELSPFSGGHTFPCVFTYVPIDWFQKHVFLHMFL